MKFSPLELWGSEVKVYHYLRGDYSTPVKSALSDGLINSTVTVLDYGCGRGHDVARLSDQGITCTGWDPAYQPDVPLAAADVVNLGFVINVIEDVEERAATLRRAWGLCRTSSSSPPK